MTHLLILFFATFSAAFMATVPPGLLNTLTLDEILDLLAYLESGG